MFPGTVADLILNNEKHSFLQTLRWGRQDLRNKLMIGAIFYSLFILSYVPRDWTSAKMYASIYASLVDQKTAMKI